jgi:hypothetical protein
MCFKTSKQSVFSNKNIEVMFTNEKKLMKNHPEICPLQKIDANHIDFRIL